MKEELVVKEEPTKKVAKPTKLIILSDLHLGEGFNKETEKLHPTEDFFFDEEFSKFLSYIQGNNKTPEELTLVLNGDTIDFLQISPEKSILKSILNIFGYYDDSLSAVVFKMQKVFDSHGVFFRAMCDFLKRGNRIVLLPGNHDIEFVRDDFQIKFKGKLKEKFSEINDKIDPEKVEEYLDKVEFYRLYYHTGDVYIEHGSEYDNNNSFSKTQPANDPTLRTDEIKEGEIYYPKGSLFVTHLYNAFEKDYPHADNVYPHRSFVAEVINSTPWIPYPIVVVEVLARYFGAWFAFVLSLISTPFIRSISVICARIKSVLDKIKSGELDVSRITRHLQLILAALRLIPTVPPLLWLIGVVFISSPFLAICVVRILAIFTSASQYLSPPYKKALLELSEYPILPLGIILFSSYLSVRYLMRLESLLKNKYLRILLCLLTLPLFFVLFDFTEDLIRTLIKEKDPIGDILGFLKTSLKDIIPPFLQEFLKKCVNGLIQAIQAIPAIDNIRTTSLSLFLLRLGNCAVGLLVIYIGIRAYIHVLRLCSECVGRISLIGGKPKAQRSACSSDITEAREKFISAITKARKKFTGEAWDFDRHFDVLWNMLWDVRGGKGQNSRPRGSLLDGLSVTKKLELVAEDLMEAFREEGLDVKHIVFGHTHYWDKKKLSVSGNSSNEKSFYFNTGTWTKVLWTDKERLYRKETEFTFLEVSNGKPQLLEWDSYHSAIQEKQASI